jgi:hypothetical protein
MSLCRLGSSLNVLNEARVVVDFSRSPFLLSNQDLVVNNDNSGSPPFPFRDRDRVVNNGNNSWWKVNVLSALP